MAGEGPLGPVAELGPLAQERAEERVLLAVVGVAHLGRPVPLGLLRRLGRVEVDRLEPLRRLPPPLEPTEPDLERRADAVGQPPLHVVLRVVREGLREDVDVPDVPPREEVAHLVVEPAVERPLELVLGPLVVARERVVRGDLVLPEGEERVRVVSEEGAGLTPDLLGPVVPVEIGPLVVVAAEHVAAKVVGARRPDPPERREVDPRPLLLRDDVDDGGARVVRTPRCTRRSARATLLDRRRVDPVVVRRIKPAVEALVVEEVEGLDLAAPRGRSR